jgi:hypothetical protein
VSRYTFSPYSLPEFFGELFLGGILLEVVDVNVAFYVTLVFRIWVVVEYGKED